MKPRHLWITVALAVVLAASNLWWIYQAIDQVSTEKYHQLELDYRLRSIEAALRTIPPLAADLDRSQVVERAIRATGARDTFEKDGEMVIAPLTFRFDAQGTLIQVGTIYGYGEAP